MGIQSWKRGVHTGNTIRVGGSCAQRLSRGLECGLIKRMVDPPSTVTAPFLEHEEERKRVRTRSGRAKKVTQETKQSVELEELEQFEENVFYSLNKKGRWNLPEEIRKEIKYFKSTPKGHSKVRNGRSVRDSEMTLDHDLTLVERHHLKHGSNCIAVHSTKLPGDGTVSKSKTYLNENSVLQRKTRERTRPKTKRKNATPQVEKVQELPTTEIQLSSAYPPDSYLQFIAEPQMLTCSGKDLMGKLRSKVSRHNMKLDAARERNYCSFDTDDHVTDQCPEAEHRVGLTGHQPRDKDERGKGKRATAVAEPEEDPHDWFLLEFVQKPCTELQSEEEEELEEEAEEHKEEEEQKEDLDGDQMLNTAASDSSWEMLDVLEEIEDCESLQNEYPSESEEFHEYGILGPLIDNALALRTARLILKDFKKTVQKVEERTDGEDKTKAGAKNRRKRRKQERRN